MDYKYKYIKYKTKYLELKGGGVMSGGATNVDYIKQQSEHIKNVTAELQDKYKKTHWIWYFFPYILFPHDINEHTSQNTINYNIYVQDMHNLYRYDSSDYISKYNNFYKDKISHKYYDRIIEFLNDAYLYLNYLGITKIINNKIKDGEIKNYDDIRQIFDRDRKNNRYEYDWDLDSKKFWRSITDFTRAIIYYNSPDYNNSKIRKNEALTLSLNELKDQLCDIITTIIKSKVEYDKNPHQLPS